MRVQEIVWQSLPVDPGWHSTVWKRRMKRRV
jgi:hypothetical protein